MTENGIFSFRNFSSYPELIHGFSTRQLGNLWGGKETFWENPNLEIFLNKLKIKKEQLTVAKQPHDGHVALVEGKDRQQIIFGVDGMITQEPDIFLAVHVADCLPLLFYDPRRKNSAVCHAGWRSTLKRIAKEVVAEMKNLGSRPEEIIIGVGPHIKVCCYDVPEERIRMFREEFENNEKMVKSRNGKFYLDLTYLNLEQLKSVGVKEKNIEVAPYCTFCGEDFFSYRRQGKENFSEVLGVLGRKE